MDENVSVETEDVEAASATAEALEAETTLEPQPDPRTVVRLPYSKCFRCAHLMDWKDDIYDCFGSLVCPANSYRIVKGMDPALYVEQKAVELADLQLSGSVVEYAELLAAVTTKKPKLAPQVLNRASEIIAERNAEKALEAKINNVA